MPSESDLKRAIVKDMQANGGYARRIEDSFAVGTYDLILIPYDLPVFMAEVKKVKGHTFAPTPRQEVELHRIANVGAINRHVIPVVIGWLNGNYYFHKPAPSIDTRDCFSVTTSVVPFYDQLVKYYHSIKGTP